MPAAADAPAVDTAIAAREHIPALDGLRGLAILLVIPHNTDSFSHAAPWLWPFALIAHAGWLGVQLFFVLSGFLITRNLIDSRGSPNYLRAFFGRRVLRIFPLYFATLLVCLVLLPHIVTFSPAALASHRYQVWLWTFTSNWAQPFGADVSGFSHFWSLAVEEQFYLVWPFVVLVATGTRLFRICLVLAAIALLARVALLVSGARPEEIYEFTICRMDALVLGAAAAVLSQHEPWTRWLAAQRRGVHLAILALLVVSALFSHIYSVYDPRTLTLGQSLLALAFALMVASVGSIPRGTLTWQFRRLCESRALRLVGKVSFAMYVFHLPILTAFGGRIERMRAFTGSALPLAEALVAIALSFLAALASWHLFEKHFLKLKARIAPLPASTPAIEAA